MAKVRITQVRSQIGQSERHRGTLRALGLGKIGRVARARGEPGARRHAPQGPPPREGRRGVDGREAAEPLESPAGAGARRTASASAAAWAPARAATAGRGIKGQKSRSGSHKMRAGFEGGQMPIYMRHRQAARLDVEGRDADRPVPHLHAAGQRPRPRPLRRGRRGHARDRSSRRACSRTRRST